MPARITVADKTIPVEPLTPSAFAAFGTVVQNPNSTHFPHPIQSQSANQGSATKFSDVSPLVSSYELSPSKKPALPKVTLFSCKPRALTSTVNGEKVFPVKIMERHPYTPQTFVPMGLAPDDKTTTYLVIVALTLPLEPGSSFLTQAYPPRERPRRPTLRQLILRGRPNPFTNDYSVRTTPASLPLQSPIAAATARPKGPGPPDYTNLRAFLVRGDQAVTYGAGTWHAPMVVLGDRAVDFVVVQYANEVAPEDCQEVEFDGGEIGVVVPDATSVLLSQGKLQERARL